MLQGINFEEAIEIRSGNIRPQSLQKVCFHLTEFHIRAKAQDLEEPYLWDGIRYQAEIFRMLLSYIHEH